jgi:PKD repeat protein
MSHRKFLISMLLIFLSFSLMTVLMLFSTKAQAQTSTATPSRTSTAVPGAEFTGTPLSGAAPLAVQFTHTSPSILSSCNWTFGDGTSQSFSFSPGTSSTCPTVTHTYTTAGSYTVSLRVTKATNGWSNTKTKANYIQVSGPTPTPASTNDMLPDLTITAISYVGSSPACANNPRDNVTVKNNGLGSAGTFVVSFNSQTQTVNGLAAGQQVVLNFSAVSFATATADSTNVIVESNESNNSMSANLPVPTQAWTCTPNVGITNTPTPTFGITNTRTRTPTRTLTPSISLTPTRTPTRTNTPIIDTITATLTRTPTRTNTPGTPTATPVTGTCSPVTSTITAPFTYDGAGTFCWQSTNLGSYVNSWNLDSLKINGVEFKNQYIPYSSYPPKINGYWYVKYISSVAYGHVEFK